MKQFKFTVEDKIRYSKIAEFKTFKSKSLHFTEEFRANL